MSEKEKDLQDELQEEVQDLKDLENSAEEAVEEADLAEVAETPSELEALQTKFEEMEDSFLRARAEISNITTRNRNEREQLQKYRSQDLGKKLLPAIDNLERAIAADVSDEQSANLKKGVEMVLESLNHALKEEGIEEIPAEGETFDPNLHQAVQTVPAEDGVAPETIVQVLQKGYKLHDRVLRPSMVIVAQ